jgi:excisionase family DNA binding protein
MATQQPIYRRDLAPRIPALPARRDEVNLPPQNVGAGSAGMRGCRWLPVGAIDGPAMLLREWTLPLEPNRKGDDLTTTTADPPLTRLLTADEVANALGVPTDRIWALTREGKLPAVKLGGRTYRYRPDAVTAALEALEG